MPMLKRETFVDAISKIKQHEELMGSAGFHMQRVWRFQAQP